jgi:hypothetical protein
MLFGEELADHTRETNDRTAREADEDLAAPMNMELAQH